MAEKKKKKVSASRLSGLIEDIKVEHDVPVLERIRFPIIWERLAAGYRIQDLQPSKIDNAIEIMKDYYIHEETLCRGVNLAGDPEGVEEFLSLVSHWLKDTQSLAAFEEGTGSIVGLLIGRVLDRTVMIQTRMTMMNTVSNVFGPIEEKTPMDEKINAVPEKECPPSACDQVASRPSTGASKKTKSPKTKENTKPADTKTNQVKEAKSKTSVKLSRTSKFTNTSSETRERVGVLGKMLSPMFDDELTIVENQKLYSIHKLKSYLTGKIDILSLYEVDLYYSVYVLLVVPEHRGKGVAKALMRCALEMAKKFSCHVVAGIFSSKISQNIAHKEGFMTLEEICLSDWLVFGEEVFTEIDGKEHTAAVMAHKIEVPEPPTPPPPQHAPRRSKSERLNKSHTGR